MDVTVTTAAGTSATSAADQFTYFAVPTVTGVSPNSGPTTGGTTVTITGSGFSTTPGATTVSFGGISAQITSSSSPAEAAQPESPNSSVACASTTLCYAISPPGSGTVDVTVTVAGQTSAISRPADQFSYSSTLTVTSVSPNAGPTSGNTSVTVSGSNFVVGSTTVMFGGTAAASQSCSSTTTCTATSPAGAAATVDVTVKVGTQTSPTNQPADQFTYLALPTVTGVNPATGPLAGGTTVAITGTNFVATGSGLSGGTTFTFGGTAAANVSCTPSSPGSVLATQCTATNPAGTGTAAVAAITAGGTSTANGSFTYEGPPSVTSVSPNTGPTAGGPTVTINGTNFTGVTSVKFGANAASAFTFVSATKITATSPAGAAGTVDVTVTTPSGTSPIASADQFIYLNAPMVTGVSPNAGPTAGGTSVTVSGTNFVTTASGLTPATTFQFGATAGTAVNCTSATTCTVASPAGVAGAVDVTATTGGGTSSINQPVDQFTYLALPTVTAVNPISGPLAGGTTVTISGTNFATSSLSGGTTFTFGSTSASNVSCSSSTSCSATNPAGTGTVAVAAITAGGTSTTNGSFTYEGPPTVTSVFVTGSNPHVSNGPVAGGTSVTITGTNFTGATSVKFGANTAPPFTVVSATSITATSPAGAAGTVDVTVTTPSGTSATNAGDQFTYVAAPAVSTVNPSSGPTTGGTILTITGTNFMGAGFTATGVSFGANAATNVVVNSATTITATSPASSGGTAGTVDVTVTTPGGTSVTNPGDQFTYIVFPTVTNVSPSFGPPAGGTSVTITGTNFTGATAVNFGGNPATAVTVVTSTSITATSPAGTPNTAVDVTVTAGGQTSPINRPADQFSYVSAGPTVTALSQPASGPLAGGTVVTITGANFVVNGTTAKFGANAATNVACSSTTQCTATSPAGAAGTVDVTVTTPSGTSAVNQPADQFTYTASGPFAGVSILPAATIVPLPGTGSTTVTLQAQAPAANLGAWTVDVTYNPNIVQVTGCSGQNGSICNTTFAANKVRVIGSSASGLSGSQPLANITFAAATGATAGQSSALTPTISTFTDPSANPISATPSNGTITVGKLGDVNGDGIVNSVDALCVLRIVAGLPSTANCPIPPPGNPIVAIGETTGPTALDALCIERGVAGLPATSVCPLITAPVAEPAVTTSGQAAEGQGVGPRPGARTNAGVPGAGLIAVVPATQPEGANSLPSQGRAGERSQGEATVEVQAKLGTQALGAWSIDISYDAKAVKITGCKTAGGSICNPSAAPGVLRIVGASATGLTGMQTLATVSYEAIGQSSATPRLTSATLADPQGETLTATGN